MPTFYALSRPDTTLAYHVYGKGQSADAAEAEALAIIALHGDEAEALTGNLAVTTREESEARGMIPRGASVVWYAHLNRYNEEAQSGPDEIVRQPPAV